MVNLTKAWSWPEWLLVSHWSRLHIYHQPLLLPSAKVENRHESHLRSVLLVWHGLSGCGMASVGVAWSQWALALPLWVCSTEEVARLCDSFLVGCPITTLPVPARVPINRKPGTVLSMPCVCWPDCYDKATSLYNALPRGASIITGMDYATWIICKHLVLGGTHILENRC